MVRAVLIALMFLLLVGGAWMHYHGEILNWAVSEVCEYAKGQFEVAVKKGNYRLAAELVQFYEDNCDETQQEDPLQGVPL